MTAHTSKDPLHGVTLEMQVNALVARYGWDRLSQLIKINCFKNDPSVKSSLKFLRRTPWARAEVEALYLDALHDEVDVTPAEPAFDPWANSRAKRLCVLTVCPINLCDIRPRPTHAGVGHFFTGRISPPAAAWLLYPTAAAR